MKKIILTALLIISLPLSATTLSPEFNPVAHSNNSMGFDLIKNIQQLNVDKSQSKNTLVSPLSMYLALSMAMNGAGSETTLKSFVQDILRLPGNDPFSLDDYNQKNNELLSYYSQFAEKQEPINEWSQLTPPVISINNMIARTTEKKHGLDKFNFNDLYKSVIKDQYSGDLFELPFQEGESASVINGWVNDKTQGMIPSIIDEDTLTKLLWAIVNTVYFEGQWGVPFHSLDKKWAPDFKLPGSTEPADVDMIATTSWLKSANTLDYKAVSIPFAKSSVEFMIVMPKNMENFHSITNLQGDSIWSQDYWNSVVASLESQKIDLKLPKFSFEYGIELTSQKDPLVQALNMSHIFSNQSDFSAMATEGSLESKVGIIKQNTKIELDEKGLKAAAATLIGGMERTSVEIQRPVPMTIDQPFYFAIYDKEQGMYHFLGTMIDPTFEK